MTKLKQNEWETSTTSNQLLNGRMEQQLKENFKKETQFDVFKNKHYKHDHMASVSSFLDGLDLKHQWEDKPDMLNI